MSIGSGFRTLISLADDTSLESINKAVQSVIKESPRTVYSKLRNQREQATFNLMMRMDPKALENIRHDFYCLHDVVSLHEFIHIMSKHLLDHTVQYGDNLQAQTTSHREFGSYMFELFKEVDVNGDGQMEWEEFTKFTVEKASLLNQKFVLTSITEYSESTHSIDIGVRMHRRNHLSNMLFLQGMGNFAVIEEHKKALTVYSTYTGAHVATIATEAVPLALEHIKEYSVLIASCANNTLNVIQLDDHFPQKKFQIQNIWPTQHPLMSLAWMKSSELLYSGANNGRIYSWKYSDKSLLSTMPGHTDIVMNLLALDKLDNLISGSLDTSIGVWDTYTNSIIHKLRGHRKGVFGLSYNPDYRLLVSCGFDHDAFVWSPFVNSLVYKLKGHRASLVSCQSVEDSPEVITADEGGVFKVWDIRTFQCVQTFFHNSSTSDNEPQESLSSFFHTKMTMKDKTRHHQEDLRTEARIFGGSKGVVCFDQKQIVHEKTTDFSNVIWLAMNSESCIVITVSDRNVLIWDMLMGSKLLMHNNICGEEVSACCLDDRKRKIIIGDVNGRITVYNPLNGSYMKSCSHDIKSAVVSLIYISDSRRFIAGFMNGTIRLYDEAKLDDCNVIRVFDKYNIHPELVSMTYCFADRTLATSGTCKQRVKLWDYDTGKCDMDIECCNEAETVIAMCSLNPFPLFVTSDTAGNIAVWGSRGSKWRGAKISAFLNTNPYDAVEEPLQKPLDIGIVPPVRVLPPEDMESKKHTNIPSDAIPSDNFNASDSDKGDDDNSHSTLGLRSSSPFHESINDKILAEADLCASRWGPIAAVTCMSWDKNACVLYTGDELGHLRRWSLEGIIEELGGTAMTYGVKKNEPLKPTKVFSRGLSSNIQTPKSYHVKTAPKFSKHGMIAFVNPRFSWMIQAHSESILYSAFSKEGIMTSSTDNLVKMWTSSGRPVGILLHSVPVGVRSQSWDLKLDAELIMKREYDELDKILHEVNEVAESNRGHSPHLGGSVGDVTAQFSHSSLRKRIEISGKILGLDFYGNNKTTDSSSVQDSIDGVSLPEIMSQEESSQISETTKTSKSALEEVKDAYSYGNTKKKSTSSLQDRRKYHEVDVMTKKFKEKGIKLPKLISDEPKVDGFTIPDITMKVKVSGDSKSKLNYFDKSADADRKCSKYSSFKALNKLLDPSIAQSTPSREEIESRKIKKRQSMEELKAHFEQLEKNKLRTSQIKTEANNSSSKVINAPTPTTENHPAIGIHEKPIDVEDDEDDVFE